MISAPWALITAAFFFYCYTVTGDGIFLGACLLFIVGALKAGYWERDDDDQDA